MNAYVKIIGAIADEYGDEFVLNMLDVRRVTKNPREYITEEQERYLKTKLYSKSKLEAIKHIREQIGCSLTVAKALSEVVFGYDQ